MRPEDMLETPGMQRPDYSQLGTVTHGLAQTFGIMPSTAVLTFVVDAMLFGAGVITLDAILPIACVVGAVLGYITYLAQVRHYGDDHQTALIKALTVGLLTAIPVPITAALSVPCGIVGFLHNRRRS